MGKKSRIFSFMLSAIAMALSSVALANTVNLYAEPNDNAKVIDTIDVSAGVVPIFTSQDGVWMKVGNSKNGEVGWVKSNDLKSGPVIPALFDYTHKVINNGNTQNAPQFIQLNSAPALTPEQQNKLIQGQKQIQQNMQNGAQEIMNGMQQIFQWKPAPAPTSPPPALPIVIFPVKQQATPPNLNQPSNTGTVQPVNTNSK